MLLTDIAGLEMTAPSCAAVSAWDDVVEGFLSHGRGTAGALDRLLQEDPRSPLGWSAKALMAVMLARRELVEVAVAAAAKARDAALAGTWRERRYEDAATAATAGQWTAAIDAMETVLERHPADAFAAKLSHGLRFMLGDATGMLRSVRMVRARVAPDHPHFGYLLGCETFALEEMGYYRRAEHTGRQALEIAPRDAWGLHAVAHVFEMTGRVEEGTGWIGANGASFEHCNNFAFHVWWHLALFHLSRGDNGRALALYDAEIRPQPTDDFRDVANAVSLLVRLDLAGIDVGDRFDELQAIAARRIGDRCLVFADLHNAMTLARAGEPETALAAFEAPADGRPDEQGAAARAVGRDMAQGIAAFYAGNYSRAREAMLRARPGLQAIGGSHAQRDVFEQLTIEACIRAGDLSGPRIWLEQRMDGRNRTDAFARQRLAFIRRRLGSGEAGVGMLVAAAMSPIMD